MYFCVSMYQIWSQKPCHCVMSPLNVDNSSFGSFILPCDVKGSDKEE